MYVEGDRLGEYSLLRVIGVGSAAEVYLAEGPSGARFAAKVYRTVDPARAERALHSLRALGHPNIVEVIEWFYDDSGNLCLIQEFQSDGDLEDLVSKNGPLDEAQIRRLALHLSQALAHVHAANVLHRDLKPSNILVSGDTFKLSDFDSSGMLESSSGTTRVGEFSGSARWMSPEQFTGASQSEASDIFGLGLVLYWASYGAVPGEVQSSFASLARERLTQQVVVPPGPLQALISACLALDPNDRPPSAAVVVDWLIGPGTAPTSPAVLSSSPNSGVPTPGAPQSNPVLPPLTQSQGQGCQSSTPTSLPMTAKRQSKRWVWAVVGLVVLAVIGALGSGLIFGGNGEGSDPARGFVVVGSLILGVAIVTAGVILGQAIRERIPDHDPATQDQAARFVFGVENVGTLTESLYAEAASVVAKLETPDATFLGLTIHAMISEFHRSEDSADRQDALLSTLELMDKVQQKLSPWHVRNRDSLALGVTVAGGVAGLVSAFAGIFG